MDNKIGASFGKQTLTMVSRNFEIMTNSISKPITLIVIPLICSVVVTFVAGNNMFEYYNATMSGFLALICACIFTGLFNSIAEVYPERSMVKREYASYMSLGAYILAKMIVQAIICIPQSYLLIGMLSLGVGLPEEGIIFESAFLEYYVTIFMLMYASDAIGMFISSMVKTASSATIIAPVILICQMAFSGALFELKNFTKTASVFMVSRWAMEAVGSTSRLNDLPVDCTNIPEDILSMFPDLGYDMNKYKEAYESTPEHIWQVWAILGVFIVVFGVLSAFILKRVEKDDR